ncbi:hypothetical protein BFW01_g9377 [Lasiodiplodia theobromae]|uniref:DUF1446 domain-containing protein n=1 Tax=Lasiodiplodia theobromae TaxID=45133 RepID=A0A5N5DJG1_9PEZI|nr:hypothetical protein DBV05_g3415 [Lasiodiplodia theobromae]KAF9638480.1 hypothetical protein BFW01_g9377 [Lasiodiplodia theobromae]
MSDEEDWRKDRPVRIANCSGYAVDPGYHMRFQAENGDVDFITGDYLAEFNLGDIAEAMACGSHPGYAATAWDGIEQTIDLLAERKIKLVINGGAQNPKGLALKTQELITRKGYDLKVAYVEGDNLTSVVKDQLERGELLPQLDSENPHVATPRDALALENTSDHPVVTANAYLGAREIKVGLGLGADIVICGRVADASPAVGAAAYWHSWTDQDFDCLAGALVAGHLIECSSFVTGANYSAFYEHDLDDLYDLVHPIAEISEDGTCVITKHQAGKGFVTADTVKCQFLYELQGNIYLNSDVNALLDDVCIEEIGPNRVKVSGIRGAPPPPTTKLAIFYRGGYQSEILINACGYATAEKFKLYEKVIRNGLRKHGVLDQFDALEFQVIGTPEENPRSQLRSTTYLRIFAEAPRPDLISTIPKVVGEYAMQQFSGWHATRDTRTYAPLPFLAYYAALYPQTSLHSTVNMLSSDGSLARSVLTTPPPTFTSLVPRDSYDTSSPTPLHSLGPTVRLRLGDIVLARSGDKGPNLNIGFFVRDNTPRNSTQSPSPTAETFALAWEWLRAWLSRERFIDDLVGPEDWDSEQFHVERVEFARIKAVHFVVYGFLGRGVSSSPRLDCFGKGFADYVRDKWVDVPAALLPMRSPDGRRVEEIERALLAAG